MSGSLNPMLIKLRSLIRCLTITQLSYRWADLKGGELRNGRSVTAADDNDGNDDEELLCKTRRAHHLSGAC